MPPVTPGCSTFSSVASSSSSSSSSSSLEFSTTSLPGCSSATSS